MSDSSHSGMSGIASSVSNQVAGPGQRSGEGRIAARILGVDDEPQVCEVVRRSLEVDPGLAVRTCGSGAEALAVVREWLPDLILLDVTMPVMSGPRTLGMLHRDRRTTAIPIVFMTANPHAREREYLKSLGAAGVLEKPFEPNTLAVAVRGFLRPMPSGLPAMREEFLSRTRGYAYELVECMTTLRAGGDRTDGLEHVRQIANVIGDGATIFGCRSLSVAASQLDDRLMGPATDGELQTEVDTFLARIFDTLAQEPGSR